MFTLRTRQSHNGSQSKWKVKVTCPTSLFHSLWSRILTEGQTSETGFQREWWETFQSSRRCQTSSLVSTWCTWGHPLVGPASQQNQHGITIVKMICCPICPSTKTEIIQHVSSVMLIQRKTHSYPLSPIFPSPIPPSLMMIPPSTNPPSRLLGPVWLLLPCLETEDP